MARFTEEEKMLRRIDKRFSKGVVEYGLIEDGDKILIGLSGGKDSLALVELLARRARVYKPRFSVVAVHVVMKNIPYQSDVDYLREYVESWGVPFVLFETEFDATTDTRKSPCFLCSWNRRKALFTVAKEQGCNKIALGHHMDDILETLLINITYQGAFSSMPPRLVMKKFDMTIIRPMCLVHEADLMELAQAPLPDGRRERGTRVHRAARERCPGTQSADGGYDPPACGMRDAGHKGRAVATPRATLLPAYPSD